MARRRPKIIEDDGPVVGRIEYIRFTRHGMRLTLSHPWWYFWAYIPGMRRRRREGDGHTLVLPNYYVLEWMLDILSALPLIDPEKYRFDFDQTYTLMSATVQFKRRGCMRDEFNRPRQLYRRHPTTGHYATVVEVPRDVRVI